MAERQNQCLHCDKNYSTQYNLNKHLKICKKQKDNLKTNYEDQIAKISSEYEEKISKITEEVQEKCERKFENVINKLKKEHEEELLKQKSYYESRISDHEYNYRELMEKYHNLEISFLTRGENVPIFRVIDVTNVNRGKLETILIDFRRGAYFAFGTFVKTMYKTTPPNVYLADSARNKARIFTGKWENIHLDRLVVLLFEKSYRPVICLYLPHFMRERNIQGEAEELYLMNMKTLNETKIKSLREEIRSVLDSFKKN